MNRQLFNQILHSSGFRELPQERNVPEEIEPDEYYASEEQIVGTGPSGEKQWQTKYT